MVQMQILKLRDEDIERVGRGRGAVQIDSRVRVGRGREGHSQRAL